MAYGFVIGPILPVSVSNESLDDLENFKPKEQQKMSGAQGLKPEIWRLRVDFNPWRTPDWWTGLKMPAQQTRDDFRFVPEIWGKLTVRVPR